MSRLIESLYYDDMIGSKLDLDYSIRDRLTITIHDWNPSMTAITAKHATVDRDQAERIAHDIMEWLNDTAIEGQP